MSTEHLLTAQVYYEDTDHSGAVYYANYLKYFERARENVLGIKRLVTLWEQQKIGFAVYKANITYFEAAKFGDSLTVKTRTTMDGQYRIIWYQDIWRPGGVKPAVKGIIELVCLKNNQLIEVPGDIVETMQS